MGAQLEKVEKAIVVGVVHGHQTEEKLQEYLDELAFLAETAGAQVVKRFTQKLKHPDTATVVGKGKLEEISAFVELNDVSLVIFDDDITPSQQQNLEKALRTKIIDRSYLILDIFAGRAQTAQARTQVELAQLQYLLPRLKGLWTHLERQKGGIGMRGPGEKEIETDRRIVNDKISKLKARLAKIEKQGATQRKKRQELIRVALVGYTNVGKSTLMNLLSKSEVFAENKLFATLDTTVRKMVIDRTPFLLSDTVGFIRKLPHHLVESFKSTLTEAQDSDLIIQVHDVSHPQLSDQLEVVNTTLRDLGVEEKPVIYLFNKMDLYEQNELDQYLTSEEKETIIKEMQQRWKQQVQGESYFVSAHSKQGVPFFKQQLIAKVQELYSIRYPWRTQAF